MLSLNSPLCCLESSTEQLITFWAAFFLRQAFFYKSNIFLGVILMVNEKGKKIRKINYNNWGYFFIAPFFVVFIIFQLIPLITTIGKQFLWELSRRFNAGWSNIQRTAELPWNFLWKRCSPLCTEHIDYVDFGLPSTDYFFSASFNLVHRYRASP